MKQISCRWKTWLTKFAPLGLFILPRLIFAAGPPVIIDSVADFVGITCDLADFLFLLATVVSILVALWAAFRYLTSGGSAEKVGEAHKTLTWAAVGVAVALCAGGFPLIVGSLLSNTGIGGCEGY